MDLVQYLERGFNAGIQCHFESLWDFLEETFNRKYNSKLEIYNRGEITQVKFKYGRLQSLVSGRSCLDP